ncbi:chitin-binding protein [Sphaerisporangium rufum]|uniref:Chitin-binding protein n=1 Tax=Sphaerisporangium rufum TaxID=1381558 RepID=A0A919R790_9ACTN|nr:lytic polysaccharide monooxygenase auxiliary activity family 9 protein [Sphaerisporangium rufum]GII78457.1 chitin-binding protein [Sphaerisporangium rufum]
MRPSPSLRRWAARVAVLFAAAVTCLATGVVAANAHGTVVGPSSRNYSCLQRWQSNFWDGTMATKDPMCWQAWQDNSSAMWNYMSLYRNGLGGDFQNKIPNGQLCSGGRADNGYYKSLDTVGDWKATDIRNSFTVTMNDEARHGADYLMVYVTKPGFDPTRQALTWGDLQLLTKTGRYSPAQSYTMNLSTSGRSGRAMIFTIWQASHTDQAFFFCSDVNFVG